jgi:hypothetical protein
MVSTTTAVAGRRRRRSAWRHGTIRYTCHGSGAPIHNGGAGLSRRSIAFSVRIVVATAVLTVTTVAVATPASADQVSAACNPPSTRGLGFSGIAFFTAVDGGVNHSWF